MNGMPSRPHLPHRALTARPAQTLSPTIRQTLDRPHGARFSRGERPFPHRGTPTTRFNTTPRPTAGYRPRRYATPQPATAPPRWGPPSPNARIPRAPIQRPTPAPKPRARPHARRPHSALHGATVFTTGELIPYTCTITLILFVLYLFV